MPTAGHLLRLIAFVDRQNIPEQLLRECGVEGMDDPVEFRRAVGKLLGFSLITATKHKGETFYELHRLIQLSVQVYSSPEELQRWSDNALRIISRIDLGKYDESETMNRRALEGRERILGAGHLDTLMSVSHLAIVLWRQGKYSVSEAMNRRALEGREKVLGPEHPDTLTSLN
ncbi:unnamed protein product, partial [Tuber aestivum]